MGKQERDKFRDSLLVANKQYNGEEYSKRLHEQVTENTMKNFMDTPKIRRPNPHKKRKKYIPVKLGALFMATVAAISGISYAMVKNIMPEPDKTISEAVASGETLETLGINEDIQLKLSILQEKMNRGNLTNEEIIKMAPEINNLCFDVSKGKLSNTLGIREQNISFEKNIEDGIEKQKLIVNTGYSKDIYLEDSVLNKNTFPKEISKEIKNIEIIQSIIQEVQNGNFNRENILNKYGLILKDTENLAASKFKLENGKIISINENYNAKNNNKKDLSKEETSQSTRDEQR